MSTILQGSCTSLEFKASLEKCLNFRKLRKSLNCFGKRLEGLEKFGNCGSWWNCLDHFVYKCPA